MVRKKLQGSTIEPADGGPDWDDEYGFGIINLAKAVGPTGDPIEPERGGVTSVSAGDKTTAEVTGLLPDGEDVLTGAFPNPAADETTISLSADDGPYEVTVYDLAGRKVKSWDGAASGEVDITWDLTEANGASVADGLYVVRVKTASAENAIKVLVTR
jgi:flagellar hook assembly protein FlgD